MTTSTTTSTTIVTSHHHHQLLQTHQGFVANHSSLSRRHPSTFHLTLFLTLAAYGSLIITAFSALVGLVLANYGVSAWGDFKHRFTEARGIVVNRLEAGKVLSGAVAPIVSPRTQHDTAGQIIRRPHPYRSHSSFDKTFNPGCSSKFIFPQTGYDARKDALENMNSSPIPDQIGRGQQSKSRSSVDRQTPTTHASSRPSLSILIASLLFTLIVVTGRLMIAWWMGQQAQKNTTLAFRDAQRAYEAAQKEEDSRVTSSVYPSSARKRTRNSNQSSSLSF